MILSKKEKKLLDNTPFLEQVLGRFVKAVEDDFIAALDILKKALPDERNDTTLAVYELFIQKAFEALITASGGIGFVHRADWREHTSAIFQRAAESCLEKLESDLKQIAAERKNFDKMKRIANQSRLEH